MITLLWLLALLIILGVLAYLSFSILASTLCVVCFLVIGHNIGAFHPGLWFVLTPLALLLNVTYLRKNLISKPVFKKFRTLIPELSETEQIAIDAGTTWWDAELFAGAPRWKTLHSYPQPQLTFEEQAFIDGHVEKLCALINDFEITHVLADMTPQTWQYMKDNQFFAMIIPKQYGGLDFSPYAQSVILHKISSISTVAASTVGVPNSLGPAELLMHYGTQAQKDHYLPRLAKGIEVPCFALTSPEAGSDAGAIPDEGIVCYGQWEGKKTLGMRLTWNKRYITLAPVATLIGLAFKLNDPEQLLGSKKYLGITCALIPRNTPGIEIGRRHFPLNSMFQNGPIQGKDIFVPLDFIIGGAEMAGHGWRMLMECLSVGRGITLPSNASGGIVSTAIAAGAYARIRRQFKIPIGSQEGIQEPLGRLGGNAYMALAVNELTTTGLYLGQKPAVISAIVKYHLTERLRQALIDGMDILGGKGICLGPKNFLGRGYQGAPIAITVEGANILTRCMIIYGQGAIRCHPYLLKEIQTLSIEDPEEALKSFDSTAWKHLGFFIGHVVRCWFLGLTQSKLSHAPFHDFTQSYYQKLNRLSANLTLLSDTAMGLLGGKLKRKERLSARLGDILSYLYLASAVLKKFNDDGRPKAMTPMVQWAVEDCLYQADQSVLGFLENLRPRFIAQLLRFIIRPIGANFKKPSDDLEQKIALFLQQPSHERDQLKAFIYTATEANCPIGQQEQALEIILQAEPLFDKVCAAINTKLPFMYLDQVAKTGKEKGVLTDMEYEQLVQAERHRLATIQVDDFEPEALAQNVKKPHRTEVAKNQLDVLLQER